MKQKKEVTLINYTNKRGQTTQVFPWTLSKRTTLYTAGELNTDTAKYVRESKAQKG